MDIGTSREGHYTGYLVNGKRNGKGRKRFVKEKDVYDGDWKDD